MVKTIYLIRHGETQANKDGVFRGRNQIPLSRAGIAQAKELAAAMGSIRIDRIFSSPLKRAMQTAEIAFPGQKIEPDELINNIDLGVWTGRPKTAIEEEEPDLWRQWITHPENLRIPGGESMTHVYERASRFLYKVATQDLRAAAAVSHRSVIKLLVAAAVGVREDYYWRFHMDNCSISTLLYDDSRGWTLSKLNDTQHLSNVVFEWV